MKQTIKIVDHITKKGRAKPEGHIETLEVNTRNLMHFEVQKKYRANTFRPKKGKGSFKRERSIPDDSY